MSPSLAIMPLPQDATQRLVLRAFRRMAAHGLRDAQAALLMLDTFGKDFRRPLVLLRAFVAELAQASHRSIAVAPCCALRMTLDEGRVVGVLACAASNRACSAHHLRRLADTGYVDEPLSAAAAFNNALADLGRPLAI